MAVTRNDPWRVSQWCNDRWTRAIYPEEKSFCSYGIRDVPIKCFVNVTTDVTIFGKCGVISNVPERRNLGILKQRISISQKSVPPYRVIIDLSIQNVSKVMVEGKKLIKNGMDRLKVLIFYDYRFKTQHQYKNYKNDTLFEMIEFREFFAVTLISIFSFFFVSKKWRSLFLWRSLRYNVSVMLSFFYDKKYACLFESKQRVKNLILVERKVSSSFR